MKYAISILQKKKDQLEKTLNTVKFKDEQNADYLKYCQRCITWIDQAIEKLKS
jgi:hypothetical protein